MYTYTQSEKTLWTVGTGAPSTSSWESESDHDSPESAAARVAFLNGNNTSITSDFTEAIDTLRKKVDLLEEHITELIDEIRQLRERVNDLENPEDNPYLIH